MSRNNLFEWCFAKKQTKYFAFCCEKAPVECLGHGKIIHVKTSVSLQSDVLIDYSRADMTIPHRAHIYKRPDSTRAN